MSQFLQQQQQQQQRERKNSVEKRNLPVERVCGRDVVDDNSSCCSPIVHGSQRVIPLLSCCILQGKQRKQRKEERKKERKSEFERKKVNFCQHVFGIQQQQKKMKERKKERKKERRRAKQLTHISNFTLNSGTVFVKNAAPIVDSFRRRRRRERVSVLLKRKTRRRRWRKLICFFFFFFFF